MLDSLPAPALAVVIGARGGIGQALVQTLRASCPLLQVVALSRDTTPTLDVLQDASLVEAAQHVANLAAQPGLPLRLVINATGTLHGLLCGQAYRPEKSWSELDAATLSHVLALNTVAPAMLMKHFLPLLHRSGKAVFATLSAKVGSIGDNHLGGWYSYRASKAALNQLVHTAAIELRRRHPEALCVALHPGTVQTALSEPFAKTGLSVVTPTRAAERLLAVIDHLQAADSGGFFNHDGSVLPW